MIRKNWRTAGVWRVSIELPLPLWQRVEKEAACAGVASAQLIRMILSERFPEQSSDPRQTKLFESE